MKQTTGRIGISTNARGAILLDVDGQRWTFGQGLALQAAKDCREAADGRRDIWPEVSLTALEAEPCRLYTNRDVLRSVAAQLIEAILLVRR